jgi:CheY-like chemotaxis protein
MMLQHLNAIVADEDKVSRELIAEMLRKGGMRDIRLVSDGSQAFAAIGQRIPSFLLLDCELPHDGLTTLRHIRASRIDAVRKLPVLMVSTQTTRARVEALRDSGVSEILTKPITAAALSTRIDAAIAHHRAFIDGPTFVGPDRRRATLPDYVGPFRRASDPKPDVFEIAC